MVFIRAHMHMYVMAHPFPFSSFHPFEGCTTRDTFFFPTTPSFLPSLSLPYSTHKQTIELKPQETPMSVSLSAKRKERKRSAGHRNFFLLTSTPKRNDSCLSFLFFLVWPWYSPQPVPISAVDPGKLHWHPVGTRLPYFFFLLYALLRKGLDPLDPSPSTWKRLKMIMMTRQFPSPKEEEKPEQWSVCHAEEYWTVPWKRDIEDERRSLHMHATCKHPRNGTHSFFFLTLCYITQV